MMTAIDAPRLMLVTDRRTASRPFPELARLAVEGGVDAIQIREPDLRRDELLQLSAAIISAVIDLARIVVNNAPDVAKELGIGLHLPERVDLPGPGRAGLAAGQLIGRSIHTPEAARRTSGVDYVIAGHVYETASKPGRPPIGIEGLQEIVRVASCPVLAIGGIAPEHVGEVIRSGACGVAVLSGINASDDPRHAALRYREALEEAVNELDNAALELVSITLNGKPAQAPKGISILGYLHSRGLHQNMVVVEHNGTILKRAQFASALIDTGDVLEVVHFVGGG